MDDNSTDDDFKPKVVFGIVAHPDDLDFGSAGSFAKWANDGAQCYYLILTDGSKGSSDESMTSGQLVKIRQDEQRAAGKILGLKDVFFLNYPDAHLEVTQELKKDIVRYIRKIKPDVVVTTDPSVLFSVKRGFINHPDHRAAGQAVLDSVFPMARDRLTFPELLKEGYAPHKVSTVLLNSFDKKDFYVNISDLLDKKLEALAAHKSQISDLEGMKKRMTQFAADLGSHSGVKYAECFSRINVW